jgi:hypothetical protein
MRPDHHHTRNTLRPEIARFRKYGLVDRDWLPGLITLITL